jgi:hypothetical protein
MNKIYICISRVNQSQRIADQYLLVSLLAGLLLSLLLILVDVKVAELIGLLASANNADPVTELVLLQKLLGQVLDVTLAVMLLGTDSDDRLFTTNRDDFAEITGLYGDLDAVMEVVLEGGNVKDLVGDGAGAVDGELDRGSGGYFLHDEVSRCAQKSRKGYRLGHEKFYVLTRVR